MPVREQTQGSERLIEPALLVATSNAVSAPADRPCRLPSDPRGAGLSASPPRYSSRKRSRARVRSGHRLPKAASCWITPTRVTSASRLLWAAGDGFGLRQVPDCQARPLARVRAAFFAALLRDWPFAWRVFAAFFAAACRFCGPPDTRSST